VRGTNPQTSLGDAGKDRISIAVVEEFRALARFLEYSDGIRVLVSRSQGSTEREHGN
jgi:hypothetical protein